MEERDETAVEEEHQTNDDGDGSVNDMPSTSARGRKSYTIAMKLRVLSKYDELGSNKSKTAKECGICCTLLLLSSVFFCITSSVPGCFPGVTFAEL